MTISQVIGCGKQKDYKEFVCGTEIAITMLPKIKIEIIVSSEEWNDKSNSGSGL
ncbi:hypothetical protein AGMMS49573_03400 [Endomicrobiia bacterium]|uniref:P-II family nitrogen regulator n=1 Tax=Endomicrobium trichonymphae TaxID=1408204 RepID=UPI0003236466|nr:P-II family nitrogen regulator [Candidatus Endomicrobium trichonymphae]GHT05804.1 hypothetical protein AGMMS49523_05960 [Endomicrobiia bacterium]GHT08560.1 hypothetical protein AGMMS49532_03940 [Endomicrobiia bacterium]GHT11666.1 hypothetical protein AGMMS49571_02340 [Endomicrobiia bacterium]GHT15820.1 hypothetical protein AGMMS49573_03400 [Endomicrobiia bacterium]GHT20483.1 hypothetical protein AGMMS49929_07200 [Endomicrobiia bacterium]